LKLRFLIATHLHAELSSRCPDFLFSTVVHACFVQEDWLLGFLPAS
jgi:hypothetical protein